MTPATACSPNFQTLPTPMLGLLTLCLVLGIRPYSTSRRASSSFTGSDPLASRRDSTVNARSSVEMLYMVRMLGVGFSTAQGASTFSRRHPLSSWIGSMLLCFAGEIFSAGLIGESLLSYFTTCSANCLLSATVVWSVTVTTGWANKWHHFFTPHNFTKH